jgi:hypothetical protein
MIAVIGVYLMAHVGQEVGLGFGRAFRPRLGVGEFAHELSEAVRVIGLGLTRQFQLARVTGEPFVGVLSLRHVARVGVD